MWHLVYKDLMQLRTQILQIVGIVMLMEIIFGRSSPDMTMAYVYITPIVLGMTWPQMTFGLEERWNTFSFLRSLPIKPSEIVASKYVTSVAVTMFFLLMIPLLAAVGIVPVNVTFLAVTVVSLASFTLSGLSFFLHFWLGMKSARAVLLLVSFVPMIPFLIIVQNPGGAAALAQKVAWLKPLASSWVGIALGGGIGLALLAASAAASAWLFTKRDLSRLV